MNKLNLWRIRAENFCLFNWRAFLLIPEIIYLMVRDPYFWSILVSALLFFSLLWLVVDKLSAQQIKPSQKNWYVILGVGTVVFSLCFFEQQSHAFFLKGLEAGAKRLLTTAQTAAGSTGGQTEQAITLIFDLLRWMIVMGALAGLYIAKQMSDQGQNGAVIYDSVWRVLLFVIAADVITFIIFSGDTSTNAGNGSTPGGGGVLNQ